MPLVDRKLKNVVCNSGKGKPYKDLKFKKEEALLTIIYS